MRKLPKVTQVVSGGAQILTSGSMSLPSELTVNNVSSYNKELTSRTYNKSQHP